MITSLIWKDLRLSAPVLLASALLLVAPYLCAFAWMHVMVVGDFPWAQSILTGSYASQWLSLLSAALIGGNAIPCEREDESDCFLASLPAKRRDILLSKLSVSLFALGSIWIANPLIARAALRSLDLPYSAAIPGDVPTHTIAAIAVMTFGLSWAWSPFTSRPLNAALGGLSTSGLVYLVATAIREFSNLNDSSIFVNALPIWAFSLGLIGVILGSALYRPSRIPSLPGISRFRRTRSSVASVDTSRGLPGKNHRRTLILKDARLLKVPFVLGFGLLALPYVTAAIKAPALDDSTERYAYAAMQSLWACCLVLPLWGGYIIAAERASGAEHFVGYLPATRLRIVSSKLMITVIPSAVVLTMNAVLTIKLHEAIYFHPLGTPTNETFYTMTWSTLISQNSSILFSLPVLGAPAASFGIAWHAAARFKQPLLGVVIGMMSPLGILLLWLAYYATVEEQLNPFATAASFALFACALGGITAALGSRRLLHGSPSQ